MVIGEAEREPHRTDRAAQVRREVGRRDLVAAGRQVRREARRLEPERRLRRTGVAEAAAAQRDAGIAGARLDGGVRDRVRRARRRR